MMVAYHRPTFHRVPIPPASKRYIVLARRVQGTYRSLWIGDIPFGVTVPVDDVFDAHVFPDHKSVHDNHGEAIRAALDVYLGRLGRSISTPVVYLGDDVELDPRADLWELEFGVVR